MWWAHEFKWDGVRVLAVVAAGAVALFSRDGTNITATYPELVTALGALLDGASVILDGRS